MDPLLLQQQLVNNNQEFFDIFNDLKSWGKEMENKEQERKPQKQPQECNRKETNSQEIRKQKFEERNRAKKESLEDQKVVKKKCVSYADWDKFDADKECEKIDEDSESNSDSLVDDLKDQALIEKDEGNKFVKIGKWKDAIKSYTNAIRYYAYDPVFYANRALCFLKTNQLEKAEQDCNISLKLDHTYVKAYQRRAAAREALNKLEDARLDLLRVIELEPKNSESRKTLEKLTERIKTLEPQKPISKFSKSRPHFKPSSAVRNNASMDNYIIPRENNIDSTMPECIWPSGVVTNIVKAIQKPPHMRSTKPLKRILINEINSAIPESSQISKDNPSKSPKKNEDSESCTEIFNTDHVKVIEHKSPENIPHVEVQNVNNPDSFMEVDSSPKLSVPKTSVQFHLTWKQLKGNNNKRSEYLRLVNPKNIPHIFKDTLESEVFSEILLVLAENIKKEKDNTYDYLLSLSKIKRFSALSMFLTLSDKNCLWKMFNHIKECEERSKEEIDDLIVKYEL